MQGVNIKVNTELTKEEKKAIDSIEKIESEINDLWTKDKELKEKRYELIHNNEIAILKHDLEVINNTYSLLRELKGTYKSDNDLEELSDIKWEIIDTLESFEDELPEGTITKEIIEI